jgi:hypothetical protein
LTRRYRARYCALRGAQESNTLFDRGCIRARKGWEDPLPLYGALWGEENPVNADQNGDLFLEITAGDCLD